jgi:hypothetical protein
MKAIRIHEFGGTENLRFDEIEKPTVGADEVLIKTAAAGINYADTMLRQNKYLFTPSLPFTLGFEVAGTIEAAGGERPEFNGRTTSFGDDARRRLCRIRGRRLENGSADSRRFGFRQSDCAARPRLDRARTFKRFEKRTDDFNSRGGGRRRVFAGSTGEAQRRKGFGDGFDD